MSEYICLCVRLKCLATLEIQLVDASHRKLSGEDDCWHLRLRLQCDHIVVIKRKKIHTIITANWTHHHHSWLLAISSISLSFFFVVAAFHFADFYFGVQALIVYDSWCIAKAHLQPHAHFNPKCCTRSKNVTTVTWTILFVLTTSVPQRCHQVYSHTYVVAKSNLARKEIIYRM